MKEFSHYTDEDFQNYFDNNLAAEVNLENHLLECELCSKNLRHIH